MNRKDEHHEPVYTDEPLEMEITEDFLPPAEELREAETKIILSSDAEKEQRNIRMAQRILNAVLVRRKSL